MKKLFERFADEELGNAVVDWTVFMTGTALLTIAVIATLVDAWF
jgi:Flp pilus assembly pilin Flp